jgi:OFA family oxalate/formate antiporter-like MFS transporter
MGFTYSTTIACAQKWYPHKRGLVTGIIVAALGFGGVIFTPVIRSLITAFGGQGTAEQVGGEPRTFMVLSVIFLVVCGIGSLFLKSPHGADAAARAAKVTASASNNAVNNDVSPSQMLKSLRFYILTLSFALACLGGLIIINYATPIAEMKGLQVATIGIIAISMFNSCGRLVWGFISDKLGRFNTIVILLAGSAIFALFVKFAEGWSVYVLLGCIGFFYGGCLSNFPSLTADIFGAKHMATNYGFVLLGFGSGAIVASQVGGFYRDAAIAANNDIGVMTPAFIIGSSCAVASIILILILKALNKKSIRKG